MTFEIRFEKGFVRRIFKTENVLNRGFNKFKATERKGRSKKKAGMVRVQKRENVKRWGWRWSRSQIFQSPVDHRRT